MKSPEQKRLDIVLSQYDPQLDATYLHVYRDEEVAYRAFASIHQRIDNAFKFINTTAPEGRDGRVPTEQSRNLLNFIAELRELERSLGMVGQTLVVQPEYKRALDGAAMWLEPSGPSTIPDDFTPVELDPFAPRMWCSESAITINSGLPVKLQSVGAGAYATVQKFVDSHHGMTLARKKLKPNAQKRERERFRQEFDMMRELRFPYILEVYRFNEDDWSYTMEFCESTLYDYIAQRNNPPRPR